MVSFWRVAITKQDRTEGLKSMTEQSVHVSAEKSKWKAKEAANFRPYSPWPPISDLPTKSLRSETKQS